MSRALSDWTLRITCPLCHGYGDTTTASAHRPVVCSLCQGSGHVYARPAPGKPVPRNQGIPRPPLFPLTRGDPFPDGELTVPLPPKDLRPASDDLAVPGREGATRNLGSTPAHARELPLDRIRKRQARYEKLRKLREPHDGV